MPTKSSGLEIARKSSAVNFGASALADARISFGIAALQDDGEVSGIELAHGALGGGDRLRRLDHRHDRGDVVGKPDFGRRLSARADRLHRKAVTEHGVVPNLIELRSGQCQAWREDAGAVAQFDEGGELVDGEEVPDPVAELRADIAGIVGKGFRGFG